MIDRAVPGMVDFLLNEPLVTAGALRRKEQYPDGYDYTELSDAAKSEVDGWDADLSAHQFAYFVFNILVKTSVDATFGGTRQPHPVSVYDGHGELRFLSLNDSCRKPWSGGPLRAMAEAAERRVLELYCDADVRSCCGKALQPGASFCMTALSDNHPGHAGWFPTFLHAQLPRIASACLAEIAEAKIVAAYEGVEKDRRDFLNAQYENNSGEPMPSPASYARKVLGMPATKEEQADPEAFTRFGGAIMGWLANDFIKTQAGAEPSCKHAAEAACRLFEIAHQAVPTEHPEQHQGPHSFLNMSKQFACDCHQQLSQTWVQAGCEFVSACTILDALCRPAPQRIRIWQTASEHKLGFMMQGWSDIDFSGQGIRFDPSRDDSREFFRSLLWHCECDALQPLRLTCRAGCKPAELNRPGTVGEHHGVPVLSELSIPGEAIGAIAQWASKPMEMDIMREVVQWAQLGMLVRTHMAGSDIESMCRMYSPSS